MVVSAPAHTKGTASPQRNRCATGFGVMIDRLAFFNQVVPWKPPAPFLLRSISPESRPFARLFNDVHTIIQRYRWAHKRVHRIVKALSFVKSNPVEFGNRRRRMMVSSVIRLMTSTKDGLGFKPTTVNTAAGALMLYHLLDMAGVCSQPVAVKDNKNHFAIRVALDPTKPSKLIAIDLSLMVDGTITADSVIDYYDGDLVTLSTRPLSVQSLTKAYHRERRIDLLASQR